jgi:hypothetical protein
VKKIFLLFSISTLVLFFAATTNAEKSKNYAAYVILPCSKGNFIKWPVEAKELWLPDSSIIENIFSQMPNGLDSLEKEIPRNPHDLYDTLPKRNLLRPLQTYYFQVLGVIAKDNHKMIYFNAACEVEGGGWTKGLYYVLDGGNCFFNVVYDLTDGKWKFLRINGQA